MNLGNGMQQVTVSPIETVLNACAIVVNRKPDGQTAITFVHQSGAIAYTALLDDQAKANLISQLSGVEIPRLQAPQ